MLITRCGKYYHVLSNYDNGDEVILNPLISRGCRQLRLGDFRIIYQINQEANIVLIIRIGNRKEVYD